MELPDRVSWRVVDAWKTLPSCDPATEHPYCHVQCPYFDECYPNEEEDDINWEEEG